MSAAAPSIDLKRKYTYAEWYEIIQTSETKYDFVDGYLVDIRAMAGGTLEHAGISGNVYALLHNALQGKPCRPFNSDLAVRAKHMARYHYPDISVFCSPPEFEADDPKKMVALNPTLIIEVLSESTQRYDRSVKFREYLEMTSIKEYVLVSQDEPLIEFFTRRDDGTWLFQFCVGLEATAKLSSVGVDLPLKQVFAGITFPDSTAVAKA